MNMLIAKHSLRFLDSVNVKQNKQNSKCNFTANLQSGA